MVCVTSLMIQENQVEEEELPLANIESETKDQESAPTEYNINIIPADFTLWVLYDSWKNKEIVIPTFQRKYVWSIKQASRLIESFMMGLPIPPVFFFVQADQKNLVIDGMQRLHSVFYFFEGYFGEVSEAGKRTEFKLTGLPEKSRWYEKRFEDFSDADKRKLKNTVLRTMIVKQQHPESDSTSIYHIFERLNTGGTSLQDQEIRDCIFEGELSKLISELNKYQNWRNVLGKEKLDTRKKDEQLILRYFALFHQISSYKKPMKEFLSKFMQKNRNPSQEFLNSERNRFQNTCDLLIEKIGVRPFNPKGPLNPSVFDAIFIAFARNLSRCPANIKERLEGLMNNALFQKYTSDATTDPEIVYSRLTLAEEKLFGQT